MEKIGKMLADKHSVRASIEDRIIHSIRYGLELFDKDLDTIFALTMTINALEELRSKDL